MRQDASTATRHLPRTRPYLDYRVHRVYYLHVATNFIVTSMVRLEKIFIIHETSKLWVLGRSMRWRQRFTVQERLPAARSSLGAESIIEGATE